jgi:hypothetical protein
LSLLAEKPTVENAKTRRTMGQVTCLMKFDLTRLSL